MKSILRWIPAILLLLIFGGLWGTAVSGGQKGIISWLILITFLPYLGGLTLLSLIVLFVWKRKATAPLVATLIVSFLLIWPFLWRFGILAMAYPSSLEKMTPSATVRLPANEPILVGWGGDTPHVNYHATYPDQRWAYDLLVEPAMNESNRLDDYGCWGVPVVAPAAGKVVVAQDGELDQMPGQISKTFAHPGGNHIAIELPETGTYLFIAHLQKDSIVVQEGDQVTEGQIMGKCGNSGNSSEPHIHIHHQRQDPRTVPFGLAEGLPLYFRDHDGAPMPQGGVRDTADGPVALGDRVQHIGK